MFIEQPATLKLGEQTCPGRLALTLIPAAYASLVWRTLISPRVRFRHKSSLACSWLLTFIHTSRTVYLPLTQLIAAQHSSRFRLLMVPCRTSVVLGDGRNFASENFPRSLPSPSGQGTMNPVLQLSSYPPSMATCTCTKALTFQTFVMLGFHSYRARTSSVYNTISQIQRIILSQARDLHVHLTCTDELDKECSWTRWASSFARPQGNT